MATMQTHVLPLPKAVIIIRCFQLAVAVAAMGLAAYGITYLSFDGIDLTLFSALATIIISIYVIVATVSAPVMYNYWAILGLDIFAVIFWVISFSLLASEVAAYSVTTYSYSYCYYGYCYKNKRDGNIAKRTTDLYTYRNAMAAASGLGGLEFILFVVTLVFTSIYLHRHRKAGGHCVPQSPEAVLAPMEQQQQQQQPIYVQPTQPVQPVYQQPVQNPVYQQQPVQQQAYQQQPIPQQQQPVQQQPQVYQQQPQQVYQA